MRLLDAKIKAAILHPEEEVRVTAVSYFSRSFSQDETVMPLVIQAVETYGRERAFHILRAAESLAQTPATVEWSVGELRRSYDLADVDEDNYRFAVALILYRAAPEVLLRRKGLILALPMFPDELRGPLDERLDVLSWDWDRGWAALEALGQDTMRRGGFTLKDVRYAHHIVGSLARHRATRASSVLSLLHRNVSLYLLLLSGAARASSVLGSLQVTHPDAAEALLRWLDPLVVNLAGAMRLESAVPLLVERLHADNLSVNDEAITALIRIDTDAVVRVIADEWEDAGTGFRAGASDVLEHTHSDLCAQTCLAFLAAEKNPDTRLSLAHAVLSQLVEEGVEPVRQLVLGHDGDLIPNGLDVRYRLVVACTMMGVPFPEQKKWRADAVVNHWGLGDYRPPRLADRFRPDQPGAMRTRAWAWHPARSKHSPHY